MKKILALSVLVLLCTAGCKKSKSTPDPIIPMGFTAKINGSPWTGGTISYVSSTGTYNYISFSASDTAGRDIRIDINNFTTRGIRNLPRPDDSALYSTDFGVTRVRATSGQINVQSVTDSSVWGTFSFTAGGIAVTEGVFNVLYK